MTLKMKLAMHPMVKAGPDPCQATMGHMSNFNSGKKP
eukprot:CAMPEP_0115552882 /NCGR_PEP_ID=MMETSP0271-20121206/96474_1 /TAXON_ID=71861 /ORGANISM="Scrippsiella trochoidea, Strain CCMP3099" /LENGTH=36 /DNA_ID= /DNA_START= /DNA_END= /DNA_ORIENTATION=